MLLKTRRWGPASSHGLVCMHGLTQHGGIFEELGQRLGAAGRSVVAVDLRGHGESGRVPPWSIDTHVADLIETLDAAGLERVTWIGHSFGGRVAAQIASLGDGRTDRLVLLDPGIEVPAELALQRAEIDRLDWSFATVDGAMNAMLSSDSVVAAPHDVVADFVRADLRKGSDGRFRFSFCPSAVVVAWSEMSLPAPPIAHLPTLIVRATVPLVAEDGQISRYEEALGDLLTAKTVPHGHNVLWESPAETIGAIEAFLESA